MVYRFPGSHVVVVRGLHYGTREKLDGLRHVTGCAVVRPGKSRLKDMERPEEISRCVFKAKSILGKTALNLTCSWIKAAKLSSLCG